MLHSNVLLVDKSSYQARVRRMTHRLRTGIEVCGIYSSKNREWGSLGGVVAHGRATLS
jgi:hypothetical protein